MAAIFGLAKQIFISLALLWRFYISAKLPHLPFYPILTRAWKKLPPTLHAHIRFFPPSARARIFFISGFSFAFRNHLAYSSDRGANLPRNKNSALLLPRIRERVNALRDNNELDFRMSIFARYRCEVYVHARFVEILIFIGNGRVIFKKKNSLSLRKIETTVIKRDLSNGDSNTARQKLYREKKGYKWNNVYLHTIYNFLKCKNVRETKTNVHYIPSTQYSYFIGQYLIKVHITTHSPSAPDSVPISRAAFTSRYK